MFHVYYNQLLHPPMPIYRRRLSQNIINRHHTSSDINNTITPAQHYRTSGETLQDAALDRSEGLRALKQDY